MNQLGKLTIEFVLCGQSVFDAKPPVTAERVPVFVFSKILSWLPILKVMCWALGLYTLAIFCTCNILFPLVSVRSSPSLLVSQSRHLEDPQ